MDIVFDIDGTLADASHRLHLIMDNAYWVAKNGKPPKPDWDTFLSSEQIAKDGTIGPVWSVMNAMLHQGHRVLFITGRPESQRDTTIQWMRDPACIVRSVTTSLIDMQMWPAKPFPLYMRTDGDRRPSSTVKEEGLMRARADGFDPVMVFEDRKDDTAMWRRNGLLCCQVAEGNY